MSLLNNAIIRSGSCLCTVRGREEEEGTRGEGNLQVMSSSSVVKIACLTRLTSLLCLFGLRHSEYEY